MPINFRHKPTFVDALPGGTNEWSTGAGSTGIFSQNGTTAENERVNDTDPFGNTSVVWETRADSADGPDGGFNTSYFSIDNTKTYRFSVWVRRTTPGTSSADGRFYLGCTGSSAHVINIDDGTTNTNPYWFSGVYNYTLSQNTWYLLVGHVLPHDYNAGSSNYPVKLHPDSGRYSIASGKITTPNSTHDFKFNPSTTTIRHRAYHFYSTVTTTPKLQFFDPRIELCDGTEPSINDLLNGESTGSETELTSESITKEGASAKHQEIIATGGDWTEEFGEWRAHVFTGSGTFNLVSHVGSSLKTDYLIVAGGGGGGTRMGGGGGGGGVTQGYCYLTGNTYSITIGAGGAGSTSVTPWDGSNGGNSTFNGITAFGGGGGGGGSNTDGYSNGHNGGSGGGASGYNSGTPTGVGGNGTSGQGYAGGDQNGSYYTGSGGGAGAIGTSASAGVPCTGGTGTFSMILGRPHYWGAGGGGASYSGAQGGAGGTGGGGGAAWGSPAAEGGRKSINWGVDGSTSTYSGSGPGGAGGPWTGGGGGGGGYSIGLGGAGGSGIVIIRYKYK